MGQVSWHFVLPEASVLQLLLRAVAVYIFLIVALRMAGRREMGQLTTFDLVLLLILSNAVQNSINAGDNSLGGGMVSAFVLLAINWMVGWATYRWRWLDRLVQGRPVRIVTEGRLHRRALARERITLEELRSALRKQGIEGLRECQQIVLEADGTLTAVRKGAHPETAEDLEHPDEP